MTAQTPDDLLLIGVIAAPFGIKGQVKMKSFTDRPDYLRSHVQEVLVGKKHTPYALSKLHEHKPGLIILTLGGVDTRDAADELRGAEVFIHAAEAAPLGEDEYFLHQLIGLQMHTVEGQEVGIVKDVLETGAGQVLIVARAGQSDALIPLVRDFITELDVASGRIVISPIEGLL